MKWLVFEPAISISALMTLLAVCVAAVLAYHTFRPPRASRRCRTVNGVLAAVLFALLLGLLLDPAWLELMPSGRGRPVLHVLIDTSQSMATRDVEGRTRLEAACELARDTASQLGAGEKGFEVRLYAFDRQAYPITPSDLAGLEPKGEATDLRSGLQVALQSEGRASRAILVLSDGIHNAAGGTTGLLRAVNAARALNSPIYTHVFGGEVRVVDLAVQLNSSEELAFTGQEFSVPIQVTHRGVARGSAKVELSKDGEPIESKTVLFSGPGPEEVTFTLKAEKAGRESYTVSIAAMPGEVTLANNSRHLTLRVVDEPIRVLLLEGKPYWDLKFLTRTLTQDPAVLLTSAVKLTEKRFLVRCAERVVDDAEGVAKKGTRTEDVKVVAPHSGPLEALAKPNGLDPYQVVILGRDAEAFLSPEVVRNLKNWVSRRGGALVCARGKPERVIPEGLDALLPVRWGGPPESRFQIQFTQQGQLLHLVSDDARRALAESLPMLVAGSVVDKEKPLARVLGRADASDEGSSMPVLTYQPYGLGRAIVLEGCGMWRWAFSPATRAQQENLYRSFWSGLLRWIVTGADFLPEQTVTLRPVKSTFSTLETAVLQVLVRDESGFSAVNPPVVKLTKPTGETEKFTAAPYGSEVSLFKLALEPLPAGRYDAEVDLAGAQVPGCSFEVLRPISESIELCSRGDLLERMARETGGDDLTGGRVSALRDACLRYWAAAHPARYRRESAWDNEFLLIGMVGLWCVMWVVRRRGGLV